MEPHTRERSEQLVEQMPAMRRYAIALTRDPDEAEDLVQDAAERAIRHWGGFRPGTNLRRWLFTIMHNRFRDIGRRKSRRGVPAPLDENLEHAAAVPPNQEARVALAELDRRLARLPAEEGQLLRAAGMGVSMEQASRSLGVAVGTVKSRLFRCRQRLQDTFYREPARDRGLQVAWANPAPNPMEPTDD